MIKWWVTLSAFIKLQILLALQDVNCECRMPGADLSFLASALVEFRHMTPRLKIAGLVLVALAACAPPNSETATGSQDDSASRPACLPKLSNAVDEETSRLETSLPSSENLDWKVTVILENGLATIELLPTTYPSLRGGGGIYEFSCQVGTLKLIEPYR